MNFQTDSKRGQGGLKLGWVCRRQYLRCIQMVHDLIGVANIVRYELLPSQRIEPRYGLLSSLRRKSYSNGVPMQGNRVNESVTKG